MKAALFIGIARLFGVTPFRLTPSGLALRQAQKMLSFTPFTAFFVERDDRSSVLSSYIDKKSDHEGRSSYRDSQIRTDDILLPKQTLYQTELYPVRGQI